MSEPRRFQIDPDAPPAQPIGRVLERFAPMPDGIWLAGVFNNSPAMARMVHYLVKVEEWLVEMQAIGIDPQEARQIIDDAQERAKEMPYDIEWVVERVVHEALESFALGHHPSQRFDPSCIHVGRLPPPGWASWRTQCIRCGVEYEQRRPAGI